MRERAELEKQIKHIEAKMIWTEAGESSTTEDKNEMETDEENEEHSKLYKDGTIAIKIRGLPEKRKRKKDKECGVKFKFL